MGSSEKKEVKEVVFFQCEKTLKSEFYKMAQERQVSPGALLRALMRKSIKVWEENKDKSGPSMSEIRNDSE